MEWSPAAIDTLRTLWADGGSSAAIARRMGVSKNAIVGKAHRLNLQSRASPIRRDGVKAPPRARRAARITLRQFDAPHPALPAPASRPRVAASFPAVAPPPVAQAAPTAAPDRVPSTAKPVHSARGCQFITIWRETRPSQSTFCDSPIADQGGSWCAVHCRVVFDSVSTTAVRLRAMGLAA